MSYQCFRCLLKFDVIKHLKKHLHDDHYLLGNCDGFELECMICRNKLQTYSGFVRHLNQCTRKRATEADITEPKRKIGKYQNSSKVCRLRSNEFQGIKSFYLIFSRQSKSAKFLMQMKL